ncbi:hypothetical protein ARMGADRAFT_1020250 [Armillaria gallica]|uniref:Uncharacterized protein n=1 Tax=Armillaria gallica TaxID=47427 RepID=A0A2H3CZG8_ARMGA|nr:hypothetical protein ARMGADRAFT_1020250 [Armillaria gallica]
MWHIHSSKAVVAACPSPNPTSAVFGAYHPLQYIPSRNSLASSILDYGPLNDAHPFPLQPQNRRRIAVGPHSPLVLHCTSTMPPPAI